MITIKLYGQTEKVAEKDRHKRARDYLAYACACEGAERDRYLTIFDGLEHGSNFIDTDF